MTWTMLKYPLFLIKGRSPTLQEMAQEKEKKCYRRS